MIVWLFAIVACSNQVELSRGFVGKDPKQELHERVVAKRDLAILFVGNSYSFGVPRAFKKIAMVYGKAVKVGQCTHSGWSLQQHASDVETLQEIRTGRWDIVVLQEHSVIPSLPASECASRMFPPLRDLVREARKSGSIPLLYQTWGRRKGDAHRWRDDFYQMNERLRVGYQVAAKNAGGLLIVPVGDVWEREVRAGRGDMLFVDDGSHPSQQGNVLTAGVFYQAIYGK
jgi:hypothetical protein